MQSHSVRAAGWPIRRRAGTARPTPCLRRQIVTVTLGMAFALSAITAHANLLVNPGFESGLTGRSQFWYALLTTTNLSLPASEWTVLGPATQGPPGQFHLTDVSATNQPQRFYRLRWP